MTFTNDIRARSVVLPTLVIVLLAVNALGCDELGAPPPLGRADRFAPQARLSDAPGPTVTSIVGGGGASDGGGRGCTSDASCNDGSFCNGVERCRPTEAGADSRGCVSASTIPCGPSTSCDETDGVCTPIDCVSDSDCSDRLFCTGAERCAPLAPDADASGCVAGTAPCAEENCMEADGRCDVDTCGGEEGVTLRLALNLDVALPSGSRSEGRDLDQRISSAGEDAESCFRQDFVRADGIEGIDNQNGVYLRQTGLPPVILTQAIRSAAPGAMLGVEVRGVDDFSNDPCIEVSLLNLRADGTPATDEEGRIVRDQNFSELSRSAAFTARIESGQLIARFARADDMVIPALPLVDSSALSLEIALSSGLGQIGWVSSVSGAAAAHARLPVGESETQIAQRLSALADFDPASEVDCRSISVGATLNAVTLRLVAPSAM